MLIGYTIQGLKYINVKLDINNSNVYSNNDVVMGENVPHFQRTVPNIVVKKIIDMVLDQVHKESLISNRNAGAEYRRYSLVSKYFQEIVQTREKALFLNSTYRDVTTLMMLNEQSNFKSHNIGRVFINISNYETDQFVYLLEGLNYEDLKIHLNVIEFGQNKLLMKLFSFMEEIERVKPKSKVFIHYYNKITEFKYKPVKANGINLNHFHNIQEKTAYFQNQIGDITAPVTYYKGLNTFFGGFTSIYMRNQNYDGLFVSTKIQPVLLEWEKLTRIIIHREFFTLKEISDLVHKNKKFQMLDFSIDFPVLREGEKHNCECQRLNNGINLSNSLEDWHQLCAGISQSTSLVFLVLRNNCLNNQLSDEYIIKDDVFDDDPPVDANDYLDLKFDANANFCGSIDVRFKLEKLVKQDHKRILSIIESFNLMLSINRNIKHIGFDKFDGQFISFVLDSILRNNLYFESIQIYFIERSTIVWCGTVLVILWNIVQNRLTSKITIFDNTFPDNFYNNECKKHLVELCNLYGVHFQEIQSNQSYDYFGNYESKFGL